MYINDYMPCFEFLYILQGDITHRLKCVMYITYHVCYAFLFLFLFIYFFYGELLYAFHNMQLSNVKFPYSSGNIF